MNYTVNPKKLQSQFNQSKSSGLILAAYLSLQRLNRSKYQLEQIATDHPAAIVRKQANAFLQKNHKLGTIAIELIDRLKRRSAPVKLTAIGTKTSESLLQLKMELDMLDDMHFEVAKSYSAFIYKHYEATVLPMNQTDTEQAQNMSAE